MEKTKIKTSMIYELMDDYGKTYIAVNNEKTIAYSYVVIEKHIKIV